ncbi:Putative zinc ribbon domain protein [Corynebacterium kalinowskii]|uniref:Zinc ribbon domain protein n=1 Tax=Corynebacterium kalinowskii TaxID=2675216 RepID=A0A6B8W1X8_9CORY|nr:C4-type zinc ribbon domain-containing protein [Corynebacterium kalinowskii]QGU01648.1 Putative zinc ribbon domain protein [Corynebacterium kalinowskii]
MKITQAEQKLLLELADLERTLDLGLTSGSAERTELEKLEKERDRQREVAASAQLNVADVELDIRRIQDDMGKLKRRFDADKAGLGAATDVDQRRDLEHDLANTSRRMSDLQQELKEAHDEIAAMRANVDRQGALLDDLERKVESAARAATAAEDAHSAQDASTRVTELRGHLSNEILAEYDDQRGIFGVGAAGFRGRSCGGCHIVLPPAALSEIRGTAADEMPRCPDCGTFLVRL